MSQIPLIDVKAQYGPLIPELEARFREVVEDGQFIRGPHFWAFQEEAAAFLGVSKTVGVANGTDAIVILLDAMEIGPGDEVICPAFTFYATAESIARRGATPVFADIDPATMNVDVEDVAAKITPRTRAIMPVHLFGRPAPMDELVALGVPVVEDAAQAFGAPGVAKQGIASAVYYTTPLHLQPALRFLGNEPGSLPTTERVAEENFSVPLWPGMPAEAQERVVEVVRSAVGVGARA